MVLGGATLGLVLGTPVGRLVADLLGWRASFWLLAAASLATAWWVRTVVPVGAAPARTGLRGRVGSDGRLTPVVAATLLVALMLVGHYGAYTYITRLAEQPASLLPGGMATLLLGFGVASAAGVALAGRAGERLPIALVVSTAGTAATVLGLNIADTSAPAGLVVVMAWGLVSGAMPPLAQTQILRLAGPRYRSMAGALIPVLFNGGIAVGAALASAIVARAGVPALPLPAAVLIAAAALGLAVTNRTIAPLK